MTFVWDMLKAPLGTITINQALAEFTGAELTLELGKSGFGVFQKLPNSARSRQPGASQSLIAAWICSDHLGMESRGSRGLRPPASVDATPRRAFKIRSQ
jgi:hypothetical protein